MNNLPMVLARNEELNKWLSENPLVLGGIFLVLGLVLLGFGLNDMITGKARGKWGHQVQGGMAQFYGIIRVVAGVGCALFGAFHLFKGLMG
jgi:hypothetical protein